MDENVQVIITFQDGYYIQSRSIDTILLYQIL